MKRSLTYPLDEVKHASEQAIITVSEMSDSLSVQHLTAGFSQLTVSLGTQASLPYHRLGGAGLERLCYSLILAGGGVPRYFGNPGQEQYGIDLVVSHGEECAVYQCKNVSSLTPGKMREALRLFKEKWLGHTQLPQPTKFVLCCPLPLRERESNERWTILEREFFNSTGVRIEFWDREYLDARLRNLPDVVADLFTDQAAERFCALGDWNEDLFRPVLFASGEPLVDRYLGKKARGQIYVGASLSEEFTRRIERHGSLLILGLPGSGKTTTGLALAECFRGGLYRIFYINMRRELSEDALVRGIRRRLTRPTIFVIDDCHGKYGILEGVQERLRVFGARQPGRVFLVYATRTTPTPEGMPRGDYSGFVEGFKKAEATLLFSPTTELFARIAALTKPDFLDLSEKRLDRIFATTGRDLFLFDQLLDTINSPEEIDGFEPEHLFEATLRRYFDQPTVHRPGFMFLTALAQFEIAPAVADFPYDLLREDPKAAAQLVVEADRPLRYFFLHSSAAELVFRALVWNYRVDYSEAAARILVEYFSGRAPTDSHLPSSLSSLLRNRLKLSGDEREEYRLKIRFLAEDSIFVLIETTFASLSLNAVALLLTFLKGADVATFERYADLLQRKIDDGTVLGMLMATFSFQFLQLMKTEYPSWFSSLREQFGSQGLSQLVRTRDILRLFRDLENFAGTRDFIPDRALDSVSDEEFNALIQRTIASGRSIATFTLTVRALRALDRDFFEKLERRIGAQRYLQLIGAGTVFELFRVIQYASPLMAAELINALDQKTVSVLIEKTISSRRSIGTLHWTLRTLKLSDPDALDRLERKIGVDGWWKLVLANGTINSLVPLLQDMDNSFRRKMSQASRRLTAADWESLLLRGNLSNLAVFLRWGARYISKTFTPALTTRLGPVFERLFDAADWPTLSLTAYRLSESPDSQLKSHIQSVLDQRLAKTTIASLHFDTFKEAAACMEVLWRGMPSKRDEIVRSLFDMLPKESDWYQDESFLRRARQPLFILASSKSSEDIDQRMLDLSNNKQVAPLFTKAEPHDILFYLWNLYSLWFKHAKVVNKQTDANFASFMEPEIRAAANRVLDCRLRSGKDQLEQTNLLSLFGFLIAGGLIDINEVDNVAWLAKLPLFNELLPSAQSANSFLADAFLLIGLRSLFGKANNIPSSVVSQVMSKAISYPEPTDALDNLRRLLAARFRNS